jgi:hypothetical protein
MIPQRPVALVTLKFDGPLLATRLASNPICCALWLENNQGVMSDMSSSLRSHAYLTPKMENVVDGNSVGKPTWPASLSFQVRPICFSNVDVAIAPSTNHNVSGVNDEEEKFHQLGWRKKGTIRG